jgi:hypothetical protein
MSDITFYCKCCRQRLVVDDAGAGIEIPCPICGRDITIPPKPVWLPAINEALRGIVQGALDRQPGARHPRSLLREAIVAAGYNPARACVEPDGPEDLLTFERLNLVLDTNFDISCGYRSFIQGNTDEAVDAYPAWELSRAEDRRVERGSPGAKGVAEIGWGERFEEACEQKGDERALNVYQRTGRMMWRKDSEVGLYLGSAWGDSLGNDYDPRAWGTGMWISEVSREDAIDVGLIDASTVVKPRTETPPPPLIQIEDERITEYLWNEPIPCDHCGEDKPTRLIHTCDACEGSICTDCTVKGCSCPEDPPPPEPRDAMQCCANAIREMMGRELPLEVAVAERVVSLCNRAFEFGFAAHHRDFEARAHRMRGEALESLGQKERALREYELALEKDPQVGVKKRIASLRKDPTKSANAPLQANPFAKAEREGESEKQEGML